MYYYIENRKTHPFYNLALEQFVFDSLDHNHDCFMLWQNHNSIIIGKNQNTSAEINAAFAEKHNINIARRLSGGGAVYHDMGNINYTFINSAGNDKTIDFNSYCLIIQKALKSFGIPAEISGRNDITIEGKKISGNAQYIRRGRVMHHGTLLYDSNLEMLDKALNAENDKTESKGIKSVKSRVTNIRPYMKTDMPSSCFLSALEKYFFTALNLHKYNLSIYEENEIQKLSEMKYSQWSWNYGASPPYNKRKTRRIEGCGTVEILLDVEKEGIIKNIVFYGDFFGNDDPASLARILKRHYLEYNELASVIKDINISNYFFNMDKETFLSLLFG